MDNAKIIVNVEHVEKQEKHDKHKTTFAECLCTEIGDSLLSWFFELLFRFIGFLLKSIFC